MKTHLLLSLVFAALAFTGTSLADTPSTQEPMSPPAAAAETSSGAEVSEEVSEEKQYEAWAEELWASLDRQTGTIQLPKAVATLQVPEDFYYLSPADAQKVLVDVWGNPPGEETLGMLFPANMTPFDEDAWAVTVEYEEDGYVSDEDADSIDYGDLLKQMREDTAAASEYRVEQGYETIELVGWAANPYYDKATHKLHWAKEIKFGDAPVNTLNYNIRVLGRKGVLLLNFIASIEQKELIERNLDSVLAMAEFDDGARYADFDPDLDKVAAYGLAALVGGKVLAKTGMLALALVFLKKFGIYIVLALGVFGRKLLGRKKTGAE